MFKIKKIDEISSIELYKILKARNEVFVVEQDCVYQDCDDKDLKSYHLFLEEEEKVIAYLRILPRGLSYDEISIGRVLVIKESRGRGLAQKMIVEAIKFIENELNETKIKISAQAYLEKFYKQHGFITVSDVYLEDGIPHIEMIRGE
ncbi:MAG: GNAT family N-acetyltransferase [Tissierellales bacterium]|nr:GNAT family N-acetyltransferase [Tissierellales bacterium]